MLVPHILWWTRARESIMAQAQASRWQSIQKERERERQTEGEHAKFEHEASCSTLCSRTIIHTHSHTHTYEIVRKPHQRGNLVVCVCIIRYILREFVMLQRDIQLRKTSHANLLYTMQLSICFFCQRERERERDKSMGNFSREFTSVQLTRITLCMCVCLVQNTIISYGIVIMNCYNNYSYMKE